VTDAGASATLSTLALGRHGQFGVFFSLLLSVVFVVKEVTKPAFTVLGYDPINDQYRPITTVADVAPVDGVVIVMVMVRLPRRSPQPMVGRHATPLNRRIAYAFSRSLRFSQEPLYFANSALFKDRLRRVEMFGRLHVHPGEDKLDRPFRAVVIECERMSSVDTSALHVLLEVVEDYKSRGIEPYFVRVPPKCQQLMERAGIITALGPQHMYEHIHDALDAAGLQARAVN